MSVRFIFRALCGAAVFVVGLSINPDALRGNISEGIFFPKAEAVRGRPLTPGSYAGVARRTTRRMVRRTTIYVVTLPAHCTSIVINGAGYHQCGTTYYQPYRGQYVVVYID